MRKLDSLALLLFLSAPLAAQTPGVSGINDYFIVPGGLPGGSSCKPLTITTPTTMTMSLAGAANTNFAIVWSTCLCVACSPLPPMGTSTCLPAPTALCPSSNQFLEVGLFGSCTTVTFNGVTNPNGNMKVVVPLAAVGSPVTLSTQAVFLGPPACVVTPWLLLFSQTWNVTFV